MKKKNKFNLFGSTDVSEDAQRLLTAWVVGSAGRGMIRQGCRCSSRVFGEGMKLVGIAGVFYGINELFDVTLDINVGETLFNAGCDVVNSIRDYVDERRAQSNVIPEAE